MPSAVTAQLAEGDLTVVGQLADASNAAVLVRVAGPAPVLAIYKPIRGERPLWDFPDGTLAAREVAAELVSSAGGWGLVPPTILREGPLGPGSVQVWIGDPREPREQLVDIIAPDELTPGWLPVLEGEGPDGRPVLVVHEDSPELRSVAAFDAVINNADRKGSHLMRHAGRVHGFDHGVSLHCEDKLRTVLWGWAGQDLAPEDVERVGRVGRALDDGELTAALSILLTDAEVRALGRRVDRLLEQAAYPQPSRGWRAIPWPPL